MNNIISTYDLSNVFLKARLEGRLTDIGNVTVLRDTVLVETLPEYHEQALQLFRDLLGTSIYQEGDVYRIRLNDAKQLDIIFDEPDEATNVAPYPLTPLLRDIALLDEKTTPDALSREFLSFPQPEGGAPTIHTFFSFKGGVGRTMLLTALVRHFAQELKSDFGAPKILLVDADTEAPGITWWALEKMGQPQYSYLDFLADVTEGTDYALNAAAKAIHGMRLALGNPQYTTYYLPAFRGHVQLLRPPVSPEQLTLATSDPWFMGNILFQLGKKLGVQHIFVDLRAGMSELSSPLFFDPRMRRVLVTTTSKQSVDGTVLALGELAKFVTLADPLKLPYADNTRVVLNFVPSDEKGSQKLDTLTERLEGVIEKLTPQSSDAGQEADTGSWLVRAEYDQSLLGLGSFDDALVALEKSVTTREVCSQLWREVAPSESATAPPPPPAQHVAIAKLKAVAHDLVYAEKGTEQQPPAGTSAEKGTEQQPPDGTRNEGFLRIEPYRRLATGFLSTIPSACIIGAKGSGKTFFFQLLASMQKWQTFCDSLGMSNARDAHLVPLFWSRNIEGRAKETVLNAYGEGMTLINTQYPPAEIASRLLESNFGERHTKTDEEWREAWFVYLCTVFGVMPTSNQNSEQACRQRLAAQEHPVVFLLDGFEDLFSKWLESTGNIEPLRVFLQDIVRNVADWSNGNIGILLFIRKDIVQRAISQNSAQFIAIYDKYELQWSKEEALRLVGWVLIAAGLDYYCGNKSAADWRGLSFEEMSQNLEPFWGQKLGAPSSKEAYSVNWALSAISDFKGNIQARDIVRLLYEASKKQTANQSYPGRLLAPSALKTALDECGKQKIEEIQKEMPILEKSLKALRDSGKSVPLSLDDFTDLEIKNISLMEDFGLIFRDEKGAYYLPEIYRQGLGLTLSKGARPKVVSLMRKALGQV